MHAPDWSRTSRSSTTTHRTTAPTPAANIAGCAATGRSRNGCSPTFPTSPASWVPQSHLLHFALEDFRQSAPLAGRTRYLIILFVAGWLGLPGGPLYWTLVALFLLFLPILRSVGLRPSAAPSRANIRRRIGEVFAGFWPRRSCHPAQSDLSPSPDAARTGCHHPLAGARVCHRRAPAGMGNRCSGRNRILHGAHRSIAISRSTPLVAHWPGRPGLLRGTPARCDLLCRARSCCCGRFANIVTAWLNQPPQRAATAPHR